MCTHTITQTLMNSHACTLTHTHTNTHMLTFIYGHTKLTHAHSMHRLTTHALRWRLQDSFTRTKGTRALRSFSTLILNHSYIKFKSCFSDSGHQDTSHGLLFTCDTWDNAKFQLQHLHTQACPSVLFIYFFICLFRGRSLWSSCLHFPSALLAIANMHCKLISNEKYYGWRPGIHTLLLYKLAS